MSGDTIFDKECQLQGCTNPKRKADTVIETIGGQFFACIPCAIHWLRRDKRINLIFPTSWRDIDWDKYTNKPKEWEIERRKNMDRDITAAARPHTLRTRLIDLWHFTLGTAIIGAVCWGGWWGWNSYQTAEEVECQTPKIQGEVIRVESPSEGYIRLTFQGQGSVEVPYEKGCVVPTVKQRGRVCENGHWHPDPPAATPKQGDF